MRTVRRLYFYILALIGAEAIVWGVVGLLRTVVSSGLIGASDAIATGISAVLVGLPVFLFHWLIAQRDAAQDEEERFSAIRAVFLFAARTAFFIPLVYSLMALLDRWFGQLAGVEEYQVLFGGNQSVADNLIAAFVSLVAFLFFSRVLSADQRAAAPDAYLFDVRRLYRYLWSAFGLTVTVTGVQFLLRYLLELPAASTTQQLNLVPNGLALVLVGAPIWVWTWLLIQASQDQAHEPRSVLRLIYLYAAVLAGVIGVMTAGGSLLSGLFAWLFGRPQTFSGFLTETAVYLAAGIPLAIVWFYHSTILDRETSATPPGERSGLHALSTREAIRRFYRSILSALGLIVTFTALFGLIELLVNLLLFKQVGTGWSAISNTLAALGVGLPLWLSNWPRLQREAAAREESGDRARRSVVRRAYLFLAIFALVVMTMGFAGDLIFTLINSLLGGSIRDLPLTVLQRLAELGILVVFLIYHLNAMRADGRAAQQSLGALHAAFPALLIDSDDSTLSLELLRETQQQAPRLPLVVHNIHQGAPSDEYLSARAVILSAALATNPPEPLRLWLQECKARRLVIPLPQEGWIWLGTNPSPLRVVARETAAAIRQMAEGEAPHAGRPSSPWAILGYVLGGLFALGIVWMLFALVISSLWR